MDELMNDMIKYGYRHIYNIYGDNFEIGQGYEILKKHDVFECPCGHDFELNSKNLINGIITCPSCKKQFDETKVATNRNGDMDEILSFIEEGMEWDEQPLSPES